jgi:hypothetical protein
VKQIFGGWHRHVPAVIGLAVAGSSLLPGAAHADRTPGTGNGGVHFRYAPPMISANHDHIVWHWTLSNAGREPAKKVVVTHYLDPALKVTDLSAPCTAQGTSITCPFAELRPGTEQNGFIEADLPPDQAVNLHISGEVVWEIPEGAAEPDTPRSG